jgi:hypothetical protein
MCRTENRHSDIGSVSKSMSRVYSDIDIKEKKVFQSVNLNPCPSEREENIITLSYGVCHLKLGCRISDIRQNFIRMSDIR